MTFQAYEESRDDGGPVQLYLFRYGTEAGQFLAYTNHTQVLVVDHGSGDVTYSPTPARRGNVTSNGTLDKSSLAISLDVGTDLAELFRVYPPSHVVTLTIYEGHLDDPDGEFLVVWAGRIITAGRQGNELTLSGEPVSTQMRRPGLRRHYQFGCPHALYGPACGANKAAATVSSTVASVAGTVVTLAGGWNGAFDGAKFVRGMVEWVNGDGATEQRTIIRISGNSLTLSGLPVDLAASDAIDVVLGCNHKPFAPEGDCEALHDNVVNFGGQPWIPLKNIINKNPYY